MHGLEFLIVLLVLAMAVPDVCARFGRPALTYPAYVIFGILIRPLLDDAIVTGVNKVAAIGFLFLLFEVGLEIRLPEPRHLRRETRYALAWMVAQYPICIALATWAGMDFKSAFIAAAALTACSVGMAYPGWRVYPGAASAKAFLLHMMVLLEIGTIVVLSLETSLLGDKAWWVPVLNLAGIALAVWLVKRASVPLERLFHIVLAHAGRWRIHLMALIVLGVAAIGERLGLSGPKTVFFLGLFLGHIEHEGRDLAEHMSPVVRGFLTPLFFLSLGVSIPFADLFSMTGLLAVAAAGALLLFRLAFRARLFPPGTATGAVWLLTPNLTLAALAAGVLADHGIHGAPAVWLLLTGLFMTVAAIAFLPPVAATAEPASSH